VHTSRAAQKTFFKFRWDEELKSLKKESISRDKLWQPQVVHVQASSLLSVNHANSTIVSAFAIINERPMTPTLMTFKRPYCRKMAVQIFGRSGAQYGFKTPGLHEIKICILNVS